MMKEVTVDLTDSDGNSILALVEYNTAYPRDYKVITASVFVNGEWHEINNCVMIQAQYSGEILKCLLETM